MTWATSSLEGISNVNGVCSRGLIFVENLSICRSQSRALWFKLCNNWVKLQYITAGIIYIFGWTFQKKKNQLRLLSNQLSDLPEVMEWESGEASFPLSCTSHTTFSHPARLPLSNCDGTLKGSCWCLLFFHKGANFSLFLPPLRIAASPCSSFFTRCIFLPTLPLHFSLSAVIIERWICFVGGCVFTFACLVFYLLSGECQDCLTQHLTF